MPRGDSRTETVDSTGRSVDQALQNINMLCAADSARSSCFVGSHAYVGRTEDRGPSRRYNDRDGQLLNLQL
eukprot:SAG31_NODE_5350_length_2593_cov_1.862871_2_plen_71_part_00